MYNGIRLPAEWPPRMEKLTREPQAAPYLENPPAVIPIDVGRQLFVDDFLIEETTLERTFHHAEYHPANPIVTGDAPHEFSDKSFWAAPFSDGVWFDPSDGKFKMWMLFGAQGGTSYAESKDGVHWTKPQLDVVTTGTNVVLDEKRDSATVWLSPEESDPERRFKLFSTAWREGWSLVLRHSRDGVRWSEPAAASQRMGDRTTVFYNPFRKVSGSK